MIKRLLHCGVYPLFDFPPRGEQNPVNVYRLFAPFGRGERKETALWAVLAKSLTAAMAAKRVSGFKYMVQI